MVQTVHIGEAAKLAGVSVDTVRFYQKLGLIQAPARSTGGYRLFDEDQIHNLKFVRHAQDLGFSLNEIRDLLALRQKPHACAEVQSMLRRKVADVREKIKILSVLETELTKALRNCDRELRSNRAVKHKDCCPLLSKLDDVDGANGNKRVSNGRKSGKS
jgi:MerR family transcriptional regulator, copper efflux regulator